MTELRPMAMGEIIDRSVTFWRAHGRALYGLFLAFGLVQYAALRAMQWAFPTAVLGPAAWLSLLEGKSVVPQRVTLALALQALLLALLLFGTLFATTAAARWVLPVFLGQPATVGQCLGFAVKRLPTMLGLFALATLWGLWVVCVFLLPGAALGLVGGQTGSQALLLVAMLLMGLGLLAGALWWFLRFALWGPVVAHEPNGAWAAFKRCGELTKGRVYGGVMGLLKVRLMVLVTVVAILLVLISVISGLPLLGLRAAYGSLLDPSASAVPAVLLVPAELLNLAVGALMYPLYVAFQVLFYLDVRVRREGYDLELRMREAAR